VHGPHIPARGAGIFRMDDGAAANTGGPTIRRGDGCCVVRRPCFSGTGRLLLPHGVV